MDKSEFDVEKLKGKVLFSALLYEWVIAIVQYADIANKVEDNKLASKF